MRLSDRRELAALVVTALGLGIWTMTTFGGQRLAPAAIGLIAYVGRDSSGQPQVFTMRPDGGRTNQLTRTPGEKAFQPGPGTGGGSPSPGWLKPARSCG